MCFYLFLLYLLFVYLKIFMCHHRQNLGCDFCGVLCLLHEEWFVARCEFWKGIIVCLLCRNLWFICLNMLGKLTLLSLNYTVKKQFFIQGFVVCYWHVQFAFRFSTWQNEILQICKYIHTYLSLALEMKIGSISLVSSFALITVAKHISSIKSFAIFFAFVLYLSFCQKGKLASENQFRHFFLSCVSIQFIKNWI